MEFLALKEHQKTT